MKKDKKGIAAVSIIALLFIVTAVAVAGVYVWHKQHPITTNTISNGQKCHSTTILGVDYIYPACPGAKIIK